jgi:hypothetical protein
MAISNSTNSGNALTSANGITCVRNTPPIPLDGSSSSTNLDLEALVNAFYGPLIYRMLTGYYPIDTNFIIRQGG